MERRGLLQDHRPSKSCLWHWTTKRKAQKKQRSVFSLGMCNTQCTYWTSLLLPSCLLAICLPIQCTQLPTPTSAVLILQPGPTASVPGQRCQATAGNGVIPPGQTPRVLLATCTITMNQKDGPPPSACCLWHIHPTTRRCNHDAHRHDWAGRGQLWKHREAARPPANTDNPQWSLCFCSIRFAAHPGLQAVWVLWHLLQCCITAAVWRYPAQKPNACRWLQKHSWVRLTVIWPAVSLRNEHSLYYTETTGSTGEGCDRQEEVADCVRGHFIFHLLDGFPITSPAWCGNHTCSVPSVQGQIGGNIWLPYFHAFSDGRCEHQLWNRLVLPAPGGEWYPWISVKMWCSVPD